MNAEQVRSQIITVYPGEAWKKKVKKMSDEQTLAIYKNLQKRKKVK